MSPEFDRAVIAQIRRIPAGRVCSYGVLAKLAGFPRHARHVGKLLASLPEGQTLPWYRVVGSDGHIARPGTPQADWQRILLQQDGVTLNKNGKVDMRQHGWPDEYFTALLPLGRFRLR